MTEKRESRGAVTRLLARFSEGDRVAADELFALVYDELRRIARRHLRGSASETINTNALVHETYLCIAGADAAEWEDRARFFGFASRVMRHILVDHARAHAAEKRGGGMTRVTLDDSAAAVEQNAVDILALDAALEDLQRRQPQLARIVECRFFGGMTSQETASALGMSLRSAERDWTRARAWLYRALMGEPHESAAPGSR